MIEAFIVVCKVPMPGLGCEEAAQGRLGEGELCQKGVKWDGQISVQLQCMLGPVSCKAFLHGLL